jgi:hypothetical protein
LPVAIVVVRVSPGFHVTIWFSAKPPMMNRWLASSHAMPFGPMAGLNWNAVDTSPARVSLKMRSGPGCETPESVNRMPVSVM